ncbi:MAG: aminoglycoside phosphotransferase family protein [Rhodospirillaceae bacterium]
MANDPGTAPDRDLFDPFLARAGLLAAGETARYEALAGGVSSDIWRVDIGARRYCIKRALAKLKVKDDWFAPISRNATEVAWLETAAAIAPGAAPEVLAHDPDAGMFAMAFVPLETAKPWKEVLRQGIADPAFAARVGAVLAWLHGRSAAMPDLAERFATDQAFHAIRLEPYLEATARRHPEHAERLAELVAVTAATRIALVHGDVSPKNILVGPDGPIFLDAECAWWGDPAFDLAFCLNHFLLKCLWVPPSRAGYLACFRAMTDSYAENLEADWAAPVLVRAAGLLPGLFLARIDGKSPVEYLTRDADKDLVRAAAGAMLKTPPSDLEGVAATWERTLGDAA